MSPRSLPESNQKLKHHDLSLLPEGEGLLAGVDEVGRGPLAGPVVASAVIVKNPSFSVRIDDSKKLTAKSRERAYKEIVKLCDVSTAWRFHEVIDRINIFKATLEAMEEAVTQLSLRPSLVIVDGMLQLRVPHPVKQIIQGDSRSLAIACASIVAKVTRDRLMRRYHTKYPQYGFHEHKGYGTPKHLSALREFGPCAIHRRSFEPIFSMKNQ